MQFCFIAGALCGTMASGAPPSPVQAKTQESVGLGFELDATEADVLQVVKLVAEDPIIRGT